MNLDAACGGRTYSQGELLRASLRSDDTEIGVVIPSIVLVARRNSPIS